MTAPRKRLILITVVLALGAAGAFFALRGGGSDRVAEAQQAIDDGDFPRAETVLDDHLRAHPADRDALLLAARAARLGGHPRVAARHLDAYEQAGGDKDQAARERRLVAVQAGNLGEGADLLKYCDEHPDAPDVTPILVAVAAGTQTVLRPRDERGELAPDDPDLTFALGVADRLLARPLTPRLKVQALTWSGLAHFWAQQYARAVADLRQAVELAPDDFAARNTLAMTISQEAPAEAAEHLERLHKLRPDNVQVLLGLAASRRGLGQFDEAIRALNELLTLQPGNPHFLAERAWVEIDAGRPREAERFARLAWRAAPDHPEVSHALGESLRLQGKEAEARPYLEAFWIHEAAERKRRQPPPDAKP